MVTIMTMIFGNFCLIRRVAASPSIPGIRTSISTMSGRKWEQRVSASCPLAASPTTSISGSSASMSWSPSRARRWSSTMATRANLRPSSGGISASMSILLCSSRQRKHGDHGSSGARLAVDLEPAAEYAGPFTHPGQPYPLSRSTGGDRHGRIKPLAEIPNLKVDLVSLAPQFDTYPLSMRVLAHVRQRLLRDAEEGNLYRG